MKKLMLFILLLLPLSALPTNIAVRIYSTDSIKAIIVAPKTGKYILFGDGKFIDSVTTSNVYEIKGADSLIEVRNLGHTLGKFAFIRLKECAADGSFNIKPLSEPAIRRQPFGTRLYNDDLTVSASGGYLKIINVVELEQYIAGVVECEAGYRHPLEFYEAQAIICRTYALNNLARHLGEYYELCDAVHCQVYRGKADVPAILAAVETTKGLVIADSAKHLINAAYFSNCGGYTLNSEDVWGKYLPYLRAVKDTFCIDQPHARWEKRFGLEAWTSYLNKKEATLRKTDTNGKSYWDSIPEGKRIYLYDKGYLVSLKDIRLDLNLHSAYFNVQKKDGQVILNGRGSGHRVGLCQEGAMHMAQLGFTYMQILNFYYRDIQVINFSALALEAGTN